MNEIIETKIKELYNIFMEKPMKILEIFNDFFGEEKVDMQGFMSIDEFKSWLKETPISEYTSRNILKISNKDWETYHNKSIIELNEDILNIVLLFLDNDTVIENIGNNKFKLGFILIHFPSVRITNEYDKFVDITHLYAKVHFDYKGIGEGYFSLNRAEYPYSHISSNYMHSHVSSIPFSNFSNFQTPCTGSGPINYTLSTLSMEFSTEMWQLLCLELDKYVQVESIAGTPYHRLESLGVSDSGAYGERFNVINRAPHLIHVFNSSILKDFTSYFILSKKLKYNYNSKSYSIGMSFTEFILTISNEFIKWYNEKFKEEIYTLSLDELLRQSILRKVIISNNKIFFDINTHTVETYKSYIGEKVCTFKGKDVLINITKINEVEENNKAIILNPTVALYILTKILNVLNYKYGKSEQRDPNNVKISEKVRYI